MSSNNKTIFYKLHTIKSNIDNKDIIGFSYNDTFITHSEIIARSIYYGLTIMIQKDSGEWGSVTFKPSIIKNINFNNYITLFNSNLDWANYLNIPEYINRNLKHRNISNLFALNSYTILGSAETESLSGKSLYPVSLTNSHRVAWTDWLEVKPKIFEDEILKLSCTTTNSRILLPYKTDKTFEAKRSDTFMEAEKRWITGWDDFYTNNLELDKDYSMEHIDIIRNIILNIS